MRELFQIRDAVVTALKETGLAAEAAFHPKTARRYPAAVAAVDVARASGGEMGFCGYLGETVEDGAPREVYGKRLAALISVDIRAERAEDCETGCETAAEVLLGGLPEGIRPGEMTWEALAWDKAAGMFLRRGSLRCQALFLARSAGEETAFLDFRLKGVVTT